MFWRAFENVNLIIPRYVKTNILDKIYLKRNYKIMFVK